MHLKKDLDEMLTNSFNYAKKNAHEFVAPEHLLYIAMHYDYVMDLLFDCGANVADILNDLEERAKRDDIPVIRPAAQNLLKLMLELKHPGSILEVGAAVGFSHTG